MPEWSKFRLSDAILDDLDSLAASFGASDDRGHRADALRETITQFRLAVEQAGRENADELTAEEWVMLGHLNDPSDMDIPGEDPRVRDWSQSLAAELVGMWEGRETVLPLHKTEAKACRALAKKVAALGPVRGYALMAALRYFWRHQDAGIAACAAPEVWLTPTAKE